MSSTLLELGVYTRPILCLVQGPSQEIHPTIKQRDAARKTQEELSSITLWMYGAKTLKKSCGSSGTPLLLFSLRAEPEPEP